MKKVVYNRNTDKAIDIIKAFTNILLLNNNEPYMIFNTAYSVTTEYVEELHGVQIINRIICC